MRRLVVAGVVGLAVAGCAHDQAARDMARMKANGPVGMDPLPEIHQSINQGTRPVDLKAGQPQDLAAREDSSVQSRVEPVPGPAVAATAPAAEGRPAPFANQVPAGPRPQAAAAAATPTSVANPTADAVMAGSAAGPSPPSMVAPAAGVAPAAVMAGSAPGETGGTASPPAMNPTTLDPTAAAAPPARAGTMPPSDAMTSPAASAEMPMTSPAASAGMPPSANATAAPPGGSSPPTTASAPPSGRVPIGPDEGPVGIDPSLGPNPDVMPPLEDLLPSAASPAAQQPAAPSAGATGGPATPAAPSALGPPPAEPGPRNSVPGAPPEPPPLGPLPQADRPPAATPDPPAASAPMASDSEGENPPRATRPDPSSGGPSGVLGGRGPASVDMKGPGSLDPTSAATGGRATRAPGRPEYTEAVGIDPSLGPNPDVMPPLEDLLPSAASPAAQQPAAPSAAPVAGSGRATQTPGQSGTDEPAPRATPPAPGPPPTEPGPPPAADPALENLPELPPLDLPAAAPASDAAAPPSQAASPSQAAAPSPLNLAVLPALGALPPQAPAADQASTAAPKAQPSMPAHPAPPATDPKAPARPAAKADDSRPAAKADDSHEEAATKSEVQPPALPEFSEIAARVGNETITLRELRYAYRKWAREHLEPRQRLDEEQGYQVLRMILDGLVDRTLLVQEAHRLINKNWDKFRDFIDQSWAEEELPGLMRKYAATNEFELRERLKEHGLSYEEMREDYRLTKIAHEFMIMKIRPLLSVDIPEMRVYYNEHLQEFHRPAQVVWREIAVEVAKHRDRGEARRKAEALLDRLRHGEDFTRLATAESEGPTADRGGLWTTTPGSYAVPAVNAALDTLPLQQISGVIEGPDSFHIIRVENRRAAGPARFDEVQDQIRETLFDQKYDKELKALLEKLRSRTLISTQLDEH